MRRNSRLLVGAALVTVASVCAGQELPHPAVLPGAPPAAVPLSNRPPYPPPLPAVVDPRTGAWRQVFVPPGGCVEVGAAQVGAPCPRCGDKLRHPFHGRLRDAIRGRHAQPGDVPDQASGPDEIEVPADPVGVELLPPRVPAAVRRVGRE